MYFTIIKKVETKFLLIEEFGGLGKQECRNCPDVFIVSKGLRRKQMLRGPQLGISLSE